MKKPNIFLFGGCDLHDVVDNDLFARDFNVVKQAINQPQIDNGDLDFNKGSFPTMGTSVISLYTKPGPIALRVLETLATGKKRDVIMNRQTYNEIAKFPYIDFYKKNVGPCDYLLMGFSPELYTKFYGAGECFSCFPAMGALQDPSNCLHWIYKEYFTKDEFLLSFDTKESLELSFDLIVDFARDIYGIFQDRVLLIKTHFSNFIISSDHKVKSIEFGPDNLLYYKQTKVVTDPLDHSYADRLSMMIMNKFRHHYSSDLNLIQLDEPVFLDSNHRWGLSQFHIDLTSRGKIAKLIHADLIKRTLEIEP
jgi:hypothetical protein